MSVEAKNAVVAVRYGDNFAYLIAAPVGGTCIVIDPGDAAAVLAAMADRGLRPEGLLATHHHGDHIAGAVEIARRTGCPPLPPPPPGDFTWSGGALHGIATPGHTRDHVAWLDSDRGVVFTGDALFVAGCGRILGSDAATMWRSLETLAALPTATRVYPGHDYTADNLAFAANLDPDDTAVAERLARARAGDPLVPSTIGEERRTNPFLRCADPDFRERIGLGKLSAKEAFAELRGRKDRWG